MHAAQEQGAPMERSEYQSADFVSSGQPLARDDREDVGAASQRRVWLAVQDASQRRRDDTHFRCVQALSGDRAALAVLAERAYLKAGTLEPAPAGRVVRARLIVSAALETADVEEGCIDAARAKHMLDDVRRAVGAVELRESLAAKAVA